MKGRIVTLLVAGTVALTACGDGTGEGVASLEDTAGSDTVFAADTTTEGVDLERALLDFAACLRDHGIDAADPTVDADGNVEFGRIGRTANPGDVDPETLRAAREDCQEHVEGVTLGFRDRDDTEQQDRLLEYAVCMRENGYPMDDPDLSGFGPPGDEDPEPGERNGPFGAVDFDDPEFQSAQEACADILGGFGPGGGRFGGAPPPPE